jgi:hypothetical protein
MTQKGRIKLGDVEVFAQNIDVEDPSRHEPFISEKKILQIGIRPEPIKATFETLLKKENPDRIRKFESLNNKTVLATTSSNFMKSMYCVVKWSYEISSEYSYAKYNVELSEDTLKQAPSEALITTQAKQTTTTVKKPLKPVGLGNYWYEA